MGVSSCLDFHWTVRWFLFPPTFMSHLPCPKWGCSSSKSPFRPALTCPGSLTLSPWPLVWTPKVLELSNSRGRANLQLLQACNSTYCFSVYTLVHGINPSSAWLLSSSLKSKAWEVTTDEMKVDCSKREEIKQMCLKCDREHQCRFRRGSGCILCLNYSSNSLYEHLNHLWNAT